MLYVFSIWRLHLVIDGNFGLLVLVSWVMVR